MIVRKSSMAIIAAMLFLPALALAEARIEKNVVIGMYSGLALVMDVHYPESPNGYGIVHVSGSGFRRPLSYDAPLLSESQVRIYGTPLVEQGYTVFSLNHRAVPRFEISDAVEDVQRAVRFVRYHAEEYRIDPDRIGAVGGSSGGTLVSLLGVLDGQGDTDDSDPVNQVSAKVQTVTSRAPVTDFSRLDESGLPREEDSSPMNYVSSDDPPILLIHGDADETVPFDQSILFHEKLQKADIETHLIRIANAGHGPTFPGAIDPPDYIGAMINWFDKHLKN